MARAGAGTASRYTLKAPRRITHERRLKDCAATTLRFFCETARVLGPQLGHAAVSAAADVQVRSARGSTRFSTLLPARRAARVRVPPRLLADDEVYALLEAHSAALCVADSATRRRRSSHGRYGYFRLRDEGYSRPTSSAGPSDVAAQAAGWDDVFVYFKHEEEGKGPEFAQAFIDDPRRARRHVA